MKLHYQMYSSGSVVNGWLPNMARSGWWVNHHLRLLYKVSLSREPDEDLSDAD